MKTFPARVTVHNIELYGYHGVLPEERTLGGTYALDIELVYDAAQAASTDDVRHAVNYQDVVDCAAGIFSAQPRHLIETLVSEIASGIAEQFPSVQSVTVRVRKFFVPLGRVVECVEIEQTVSR